MAHLVLDYFALRRSAGGWRALSAGPGRCRCGHCKAGHILNFSSSGLFFVVIGAIWETCVPCGQQRPARRRPAADPAYGTREFCPRAFCPFDEKSKSQTLATPARVCTFYPGQVTSRQSLTTSLFITHPSAPSRPFSIQMRPNLRSRNPTP